MLRSSQSWRTRAKKAGSPGFYPPLHPAGGLEAINGSYRGHWLSASASKASKGLRVTLLRKEAEFFHNSARKALDW